MQEIKIGDKFGRLVVLRESSRASSKRRERRWFVRCDCGKALIVRDQSLKRGLTKSCGCLALELKIIRSRTHGLTKIPEYKIWNTMIQRCHNKNSTKYRRYGARGIHVCRAWRESFERFIRYVGRRPTNKHSIGRIDNNGNYEPGNVIWDTAKSQASNRSSNVFVTIRGVTKTATEWAVENQISPKIALDRIRSGWKRAIAVTKPKGWSRR
jgi:hypothetical protein